ncbi:diguanylate cyclase [Roseomonas elaeocarpi]|uniref:Diguanylate cyclase n=1 Tax=Roseomonas elaeocarpi TaxID=907779 RepID=A0ABV6JSS5_9PROT
MVSRAAERSGAGTAAPDAAAPYAAVSDAAIRGTVLPRVASTPPRRRTGMRGQLALAFAGLAAACALCLGLILGHQAYEEAGAARRRDLGALAALLDGRLAADMEGRVVLLSVLSRLDQFNTEEDLPRAGALLDNLRRGFPNFAWLGIADPAGRVVASSSNLLLGADVSARPWFARGRDGLFVGDVHDAVLLARLLPQRDGEPWRFVDIALPLRSPDGRLLGVLGAHIDWRWAAAQERSTVLPFGSRRGIDLLVVARDGEVLLGPDALAGTVLRLPLLDELNGQRGATAGGADASGTDANGLGAGGTGAGGAATVGTGGSGTGVGEASPGAAVAPAGGTGSAGEAAARRGVDGAAAARGALPAVTPAVQRWPDGRDYLTAAVAARGGGSYPGLGWAILARQPAEMSYASGRQVITTVALWGGAVALFCAALGWFLADWIAAPLARIARLVDRLRLGEGQDFPPVRGPREVEALSDALRRLLGALTRKEAALSAAEEAGRRDPMTGLLNRAGLAAQLESFSLRARLGGRGFALLCLDLDRFKPVNDEHGHAAGDAVLREAAQRLGRCVRGSDVVARIGGDEFVLLLEEQAGLSSEGGSAEVGRRVLESIGQRPFTVPGEDGRPVTVSVGCSIGATAWSRGVTDTAELLRHADAALYAAKRGGRNRMAFHHPSLPEAAPGGAAA